MAPTATTASMNFISDLDLYKTEKPYNCRAEGLGELTNLVFEPYSGIPVNDVRGSEHKFSLEEHGFTFFKHKSNVTGDIGSIGFIKAYLDETVELLKDFFHSEKVICYDLRVSHSSTLPSSVQKLFQILTSK